MVVAPHIATPRDTPDDPIAFQVFGALIRAPLVENILFILIVEFLLVFSLPHAVLVLIVALLSGLAQGLAADWRALSGFVLFAVMSCSYLLWSERTFSQRYNLTVAQHVLFNTPATIAIIVSAPAAR